MNKFDKDMVIFESYLEEDSYGADLGKSILGFALAPIYWVAYRAVRSMFDKCTKKCGVISLNTMARQLCMTVCQRQKLQGELQIVKKASKSDKESAVAAASTILKLENLIFEKSLKIKDLKNRLGSLER